MNANNNNVRCETSRTFRKKNREYVNEKIKKLKQTTRTKISETYKGKKNKLKKLSA
jgi:hypothetical protein